MIVTAPASVFDWFQAAEAAYLATTTMMMAAVIVPPTTPTATATIEMIAVTVEATEVTVEAVEVTTALTTAPARSRTSLMAATITVPKLPPITWMRMAPATPGPGAAVTRLALALALPLTAVEAAPALLSTL